MTDIDNENNRFNGHEDDFNGYNEPDDDFEDEEDEYEYKCGYKKPPKHTQFKKGHSGNPKGRPKTSKNPAEALAKELSSPIQIKMNGKIKNIKAMDLIYKKAVQMALQGNISLLKKLLESPIIDPYLFKDAINKYNCPPTNTPKTPTPEMKILVNMAREAIRDGIERRNEQRKRGEIE